MASYDSIPADAPSSGGKSGSQRLLPLLGTHYVDIESVNYDALIRLLGPPAHLEAGDSHA